MEASDKSIMGLFKICLQQQARVSLAMFSKYIIKIVTKLSISRLLHCK